CLTLKVWRRLPSSGSSDLSKTVPDEPVSRKNGSSSPLSRRRVTKSQFPRPASGFMVISAGRTVAGVSVTEGWAGGAARRVAQEPRKRLIKTASAGKRRGLLTRLFEIMDRAEKPRPKPEYAARSWFRLDGMIFVHATPDFS